MMGLIPQTSSYRTLRQRSQLVTTSVIPAKFFGNRLNPHRVRRPSLDVLDYAHYFFAPSICGLPVAQEAR